MKTITPKEQNFIDQMVSHYGKKTATQCAIDSGFGVAGARSRATELMKRYEIRNEIDKRLEEIRKKWLITKDKHFQELGELREMAKTSKNVNAAVRAEELRGKVAGLYIDRQIMATANMKRLPDGTMKAESDMTQDDWKSLMNQILVDYKDVVEGDDEEEVKKVANKNSRKKTKR
tara:strand:+ start:442 stop:966 length:525 start_codon:yes stop_codon:yes gene_type:complete